MRTALITGTSSGFGLATTVELARRGWHVFATMRNLQKRARLEEAVTKAGFSERVTIARLDVTDRASMKAALEELLPHSDNRLDAVVHNAGIAVGAAFEELPEIHMRRVMETNFFGVLELTRLILPYFRKQRSGRIVVLSSNSAFAGEPTNAIYCASKWAIEGWAESLAYEIEPFGIEIVLIEPEYYLTEIWNNTPNIRPPGGAYGPLLERIDTALSEHLKKSARDPQEVASVIGTALDARRPRFRYPVGPLAHLGHVARGKIPSRLLRIATARYIGLNRVTL